MTRSQLAKKIRVLHRRGEALNIHAVKRNHPALLEAACSFTPYLGWKQALELAGLDYRSIRIDLEPYVECRICHSHFRNLTTHLVFIHEISPTEYRAEFPGAEILSEEYIASRTRKAATTFPHWEPLPSIEYIKDRAWFWHSQHGRANTLFIMENDNSILSGATLRGWSWQDVLRSVGLDPRTELLVAPNIYQTREDIVLALQKRARQGKPLAQDKIIADDMPLRSAIYHVFGSMPAVMRAAGLTRLWKEQNKLTKTDRSKCKYPDRDSIIAEIKRRNDAGLSITLGVAKEDRSLTNSAYTLFGSWRAAIKAAGLWEEHVRGFPRARRTYTKKEAVVAALQLRAKKGLSLAGGVVMEEDMSLYKAIPRRFGSWKAAIEAAGLTAWHERQIKQARRKRLRFPDRQSIIEGLKRHVRDGHPLTSTGLDANDSTLRSMMYKHFKTLEEAVEAAGFLELHRRGRQRAPKS